MVKMVIGMVKIISTGFTKAFSNASTSATTNAVVPLSMVTPGIRYDTISAARAVTSNLP